MYTRNETIDQQTTELPSVLAKVNIYSSNLMVLMSILGCVLDVNKLNFSTYLVSLQVGQTCGHVGKWSSCDHRGRDHVTTLTEKRRG